MFLVCAQTTCYCLVWPATRALFSPPLPPSLSLPRCHCLTVTALALSLSLSRSRCLAVTALALSLSLSLSRSRSHLSRSRSLALSLSLTRSLTLSRCHLCCSTTLRHRCQRLLTLSPVSLSRVRKEGKE
jgi:hypothetical protein